MNAVFSENLFLQNDIGKQLYNTCARDLPIIDYHCHLLPQEIYENRQFEDIGEMWLAHDHYKWRAMRTFGIDERYITGAASYYEKYIAFAEILPQLAGNPIYIWCALELKRYFGIDQPLGPQNADAIYQLTKSLIVKRNMTPRWCMEVSRVEVVATTDDPADTLDYHRKMKDDDTFQTRILPAFRPDKSFYCEKLEFAGYLPRLAAAAGCEITDFSTLIGALEERLLYFKTFDTTISDTGIEAFHWCDCTPQEADEIFRKAAVGQPLAESDIRRYRSAFLLAMGEVYHRHGFVMQLHIGTYQGANKSREADVGVACGFDCTDDSTPIKSIGELLNRLTAQNTLPKTLLYPLNPTQMEPFAVLAAGFCEGGTRAKVQLGAPWWFNDQAYGIGRQFETVANLYPLSLSVGMLTDSRSFLSYPRHELYRRVLCNYLGTLVERGEYFSGVDALKQIVRDVCYENAKNFFGL